MDDSRHPESRPQNLERGSRVAGEVRQPNLARLFFERARVLGDRPFLWSRRDGAWTSLSWAEAARQVRALASGLRALGIAAGDRIVLVSENRPEWLIADLAVLCAGAITVPAYVTNTVDDHRHVLANAGARAAIVSTPVLLASVREAAASCPSMELLIRIEPRGPGAREQATAPAGAVQPEGRLRVHEWADVLLQGDPAEEPEAAVRLRRGDLACIIHTSGTGGLPKGVMLSHGAILSNLEGATLHFRELDLRDEVFLSVLPVSHAYEHTAGQFFPIFLGAQIYYLDAVAGITTAFRECRPTLMTAVPRLCEVFHERIMREATQQGWWRRRLFHAALRLGQRRLLQPGRPGFAERILDLLLDRTVRARIRARFGGRIKVIISGGAPLAPDLGVFFNALGIRVVQGYGQTESGPVVSCNPPLRPRHHTVGIPFRGTEVRVAADGEILVRGELAMLGYWNDPATTAQVLQDGWLHTGDVGSLDPDGYLAITDRKKDIIKSSGGDRISPLRVESVLLAEPEIAQAVVFGDGRPQLVAVVVPQERAWTAWAVEQGLPPDLARCAGEPAFQRLLGAAVERANRQLSPPERVRRFVVAREPFTPSNGLLTPTLKARRHRILEVYQRELDRL